MPDLADQNPAWPASRRLPLPVRASAAPADQPAVTRRHASADFSIQISLFKLSSGSHAKHSAEHAVHGGRVVIKLPMLS